MARIAVVAGGGAAPGLAALAGAAARAGAARGAEALLLSGGFGGTLRPLDPAGPDPDPAAVPFPDLARPGGAECVAARLGETGVTGLLVAGGEGAAAGAAALAKAGVAAVFVPATVFDNVRGTEACLGVDTFVNGVVRRIAAERAAGRPMVVEVPGMLAGHAALLIAIGAGARGAVLVERPFPWDSWTAAVKGGAEPPVLVCAEGAGSKAEAEARMAAAWPATPALVLHVADLDRGGTPSLFDRLLALRFAESAVEALLGAATGRMIAFRGGLCTPIPLAEAAGRRRQVPPELFELAKRAGVIFE